MKSISAPDEDWGSTTDVGYVYVIDGYSTGLETTSDIGFTQGSGGLVENYEAGDHFGSRTWITDVDSDGYDDIVIHVPGEPGCGSDAEGYHVVYGGSGGISASGDWSTCNTSLDNVLNPPT